MTMIVIFVPSPPQPPPLLESATSPPSTVFSSPTRAPCVRRLHTTSVRGPCGREKRDLSFSLFPSRGDGETRGDREDSEIPSRPVYSLLSLGPAHRRARARESRLTPTSLSACHSPSYRLSLARSFPVRPTIPLYPSKGFAPFCIFVIARLSARAEEGSSSRASVGRPRTAYLCSTSYTSVDNNRNFRWR